jgi:hypothetical protein
MPDPQGRGRPTKYTPFFARQAAKLARRGLTRFEIAELLEIDRVTLWRWEVAYPDFCNALRAQANVANDRVKRSLYERAVGYSFESEKIFCNKDGIQRTDCVEHVPPDVKAIELWLCNRDKENWRRVPDLEGMTVPVTLVFDDPTQRPPGYTRKHRTKRAA